MNTKSLTADTKDELKSSAPKPANIKLPDFASAPVTDTLATLKVNPDTGLSRAEVDIRRKENGYNEVAEKKRPPGFHIPPKILGHLGVDARTDHGSVSRAPEIFRSYRGKRTAGNQCPAARHT
jgi:hypothetical protein